MNRKTRLVLFAFIAFLLVSFIYLSKRQDLRVASLSDRFTIAVLQPVIEICHDISHYFSNLLDQYIFLADKHEENTKLKEMVALLQIQNQSLLVQLDQKKMDEETILQFDYLGRKILRADIISFDPFTQSKMVMITGGKDKNIQVDSVVVTSDGLVGKVFAVYNHSSKVQLVVDHYLSVDAKNTRTNLRCLVQGLRLNQLEAQRFSFLSQVEFIDHGHELEAGDKLVTSGLGGVYPPGILIGTVLDVSYSEQGYFEKSLVLPGVDFTKLNAVYVLLDR